MPDYSKLVIIIPTINECTLDLVTTSAKHQAPGAEIILLGYGDAARVARENKVGFLDLKKKTWKSIAINTAMEHTRRDWIAVLDADAVPQPGWAENMLKEFESGRQLFSGGVDIHAGNTWMKVYNLSLLHEFLKGKKSSDRRHLPAISLGFTREFFNANGPLSPEIDRSEDYEWTLRAYRKGLIPHFSPVASILHLPVNKMTFASVWRFWENSGKDNLKIRQLYADTLGTPFFMRWPWFVLLTSPILAIYPTFRILKSAPKEFLKYWYLVPSIYLTKIAWCVGVYKNSKSLRKMKR